MFLLKNKKKTNNNSQRRPQKTCFYFVWKIELWKHVKNNHLPRTSNKIWWNTNGVESILPVDLCMEVQLMKAFRLTLQKAVYLEGLTLDLLRLLPACSSTHHISLSYPQVFLWYFFFSGELVFKPNFQMFSPLGNGESWVEDQYQ